MFLQFQEKGAIKYQSISCISKNDEFFFQNQDESLFCFLINYFIFLFLQLHPTILELVKHFQRFFEIYFCYNVNTFEDC